MFFVKIDAGLLCKTGLAVFPTRFRQTNLFLQDPPGVGTFQFHFDVGHLGFALLCKGSNVLGMMLVKIHPIRFVAGIGHIGAFLIGPFGNEGGSLGVGRMKPRRGVSSY